MGFYVIFMLYFYRFLFNILLNFNGKKLIKYGLIFTDFRWNG